MRDIFKYSAIAVVIALCAACDKVPLLAPGGSTITLSANATTIPAGGSVGLTAFVAESSGTPVQNGTTVRFTTTLGTVTPEAQTTNGIAVATFQAGSASGVAEIHAISGAATGGSTGSGSSAGTSNVIKITIGAAAVNTLSVTASPGTVSSSGGAVQVTATVLDTNGGSLAGVPVTFTSDQGSVAPSVVTTDSSGQATATLVTSVDTTVTASAGTKTATVKVVARGGPVLTITCTPTSCSAQANGSNTATFSFTIKKGTGSTTLRDAIIDFGDGTTQALGTLTSDTTVSHTYQGPSSSTQATYAVAVRATDVNGEATTASTAVTVTARAPLGVAVTPGTQTTNGNFVSQQFTADVTPATGGADSVQKYEWDFGDGTTATTSAKTTTHVYDKGAGRRTVTVKVTTTDGRSATGQTEIVIP